MLLKASKRLGRFYLDQISFDWSIRRNTEGGADRFCLILYRRERGGCFSEPSGFKRSNSVLCDFDVFPAAHQPTRCDARVSVACISASLICIQAIAAAPSTVICGYGRDFDGLAGVISTSLICVQAHSLWRTPTRLSDLTAYHTYWYVTVRVYFGRFLSTLDNVPQLSDSVPRLFLRHWLLFRCTLAY